MKTPRDKYYNDNHFRALVDMMVGHIHQCNYTPSEMREAAILASIIHEQETIRSIIVPTMPEHVEKSLNDYYKWADEWIRK